MPITLTAENRKENGYWLMQRLAGLRVATTRKLLNAYSLRTRTKVGMDKIKSMAKTQLTRLEKAYKKLARAKLDVKIAKLIEKQLAEYGRSSLPVEEKKKTNESKDLKA